MLYNISSGPDYGYPGLKLDPKGLKFTHDFPVKNLEKYIKKLMNLRVITIEELSQKYF